MRRHRPYSRDIVEIPEPAPFSGVKVEEVRVSPLPRDVRHGDVIGKRERRACRVQA